MNDETNKKELISLLESYKGVGQAKDQAIEEVIELLTCKHKDSTYSIGRIFFSNSEFWQEKMLGFFSVIKESLHYGLTKENIINIYSKIAGTEYYKFVTIFILVRCIKCGRSDEINISDFERYVKFMEQQ
jgi:hypothetical protein